MNYFTNYFIKIREFIEKKVWIKRTLGTHETGEYGTRSPARYLRHGAQMNIYIAQDSFVKTTSLILYIAAITNLLLFNYII